MRILIVEDEVMIREGLSNLIKTHTGHTVIGEGRVCVGGEIPAGACYHGYPYAGHGWPADDREVP